MNTSEEHSSTISVIPLATTRFHGTLISHEVAESIRSLWSDEKILLLYNRRGHGRAWICRDCSYFPLCPHCDIALAYHAFPHPQHVCHQCWYRSELIHSCPVCSSLAFQEVGIGIQKVVDDLEKNFPNTSIFRFDSDTKQKKSTLIASFEPSKIIVSTYAGISLVHSDSIVKIVFLLFESDLTLPDYRMEEDLYHTLDYAKKSWKEMYIQTYIPDHPLLLTLTEGNYRDFLKYMSEERKKFSYPPYLDFVIIRIHDSSKEKLENMRNKLVNKIEILKNESIQFFYDREISDRSHGEWITRLLIKGKNLQSFLNQFDTEFIKNRSITLEWN